MRSKHVVKAGLRLAALGCLVLLLVPAGSYSETPDRDKQIAEIEAKLKELNAKLAELKNGKSAPAGTRTFELADILAWKSVRGASLSPDGQWFAYRIGPAEGDSEVILRQVKGDKEHKFPGGSGKGPGTIAFSHDSKWFAFSVSPPDKQAPAAGPQEKQPAAARPASLRVGLVNLASGEKQEFEGMRRFAFSGEAGTWLALHRAPEPSGPASVTPPLAPPGGTQPVAGGAQQVAAADLILRELATGNELTLGNVAEFAFDKSGNRLALAIDAHGLGSIQLRDMKTAALHSLDSGKASYQHLHWTDSGDALAALKAVEDKAYEGKRCRVVAFTDFSSSSLPRKVVYDPTADTSFPKDMTISPNRPPSWTEDRSTLLFGIHELKKKEEKAAPKAGAKPAEKPPEKPDLVVWHWKDERLQPMQQVQAGADRSFSYLCAWRVADRKFLRLADDTLRTVTVAPKERWAIGVDTKPYLRMSNLDGRRYEDVYVIDLKTGERRLALKGVRWYFGPSPDGTHILYYRDGNFEARELETNRPYNVTAHSGQSFVDTEDDHNVDKPPARFLGWSKDSRSVLLSDNWDIWKVGVHGDDALNLTASGKKDAVRYRSFFKLDPEEKGIDLSAPLYVSMQEEWTKEGGIGRIDPGKPGATRLLWGPANFGALLKAKKADVFVWTRESEKDYPDYWTAGASFLDPKRLTNANPQQGQYAWSSGALIVDYTSKNGDRLQGALFLPAGYEKGKRYPTIVYIYEKLSSRMHAYWPPAATGFNKSIYTNLGYAVFMPDIKYKINDPGMSAVACVLPALEAAINTGVVDPGRVGLHGHSWGGYQTAFLITQTDAFKAAVAGAPLTDLVSMYSSVYWNTGSANQPIFESSQGRFTTGYWDNLDAYIRNSPVYHARNVKTPLLLLHNDKDGAVDWNQGIEYFNTLRRLEKPVVMLQYKGENHGLVKPANQHDYYVRMREFFDHHLRGKPAPRWLEEGVPHLEIDKHLKERQ
jgi:dienelactone hydrolase